MIVMEKQRDIAILKSMGATRRSVMYVFMIQGLLIGVIGMLAGIAIGGGFCYFAQGRQLIKLPRAPTRWTTCLSMHTRPTFC